VLVFNVLPNIFKHSLNINIDYSICNVNYFKNAYLYSGYHERQVIVKHIDILSKYNNVTEIENNVIQDDNCNIKTPTFFNITKRYVICTPAKLIDSYLFYDKLV